MKKYMVRIRHIQSTTDITTFILYLTNKEKQVLNNTLEIINKTIFIPKQEKIGFLECEIKEVI